MTLGRGCQRSLALPTNNLAHLHPVYSCLGSVPLTQILRCNYLGLNRGHVLGVGSRQVDIETVGSSLEVGGRQVGTIV